MGTPNDSPRVSLTEERKMSAAEPLRNSAGSNPPAASAETPGGLKPISTLVGEATREEWLQWLLVSPEAEERTLFIVGYGSWYEHSQK